MATWVYQEVPRKRWVFEYGNDLRIELLKRTPEEERSSPDEWSAELWLGGRHSSQPMRAYCVRAPTVGSAQLAAIKWAIAEFRTITAALERMARLPPRKSSQLARSEESHFEVPADVEFIMISDLRPLQRGYWVHDIRAIGESGHWGVDGLGPEEAKVRLFELGWVFSREAKAWVRSELAKQA